jgi:hypothetical protein
MRGTRVWLLLAATLVATLSLATAQADEPRAIEKLFDHPNYG